MPREPRVLLGLVRAPKRLTPFLASSPRLRPTIRRTLEVADHRQARSGTHHSRKRPRLVISALRESLPRQGHPRHHVRQRPTVLKQRGHSGPERGRHRPIPRELQLVNREPDRPVVSERRPRAGNHLRRAESTPIRVLFRRTPTSLTPGRPEHSQLPVARITKRPESIPTPRAPARKHQIDRRPRHASAR